MGCDKNNVCMTQGLIKVVFILICINVAQTPYSKLSTNVRCVNPFVKHL